MLNNKIVAMYDVKDKESRKTPFCHVLISYGTQREQRGPTSPSGHWDSVSGVKIFESSIIKQKQEISPHLRQGINKGIDNVTFEVSGCCRIFVMPSCVLRSVKWKQNQKNDRTGERMSGAKRDCRFLEGNKNNPLEEERRGGNSWLDSRPVFE